MLESHRGDEASVTSTHIVQAWQLLVESGQVVATTVAANGGGDMDGDDDSTTDVSSMPSLSPVKQQPSLQPFLSTYGHSGLPIPPLLSHPGAASVYDRHRSNRVFDAGPVVPSMNRVLPERLAKLQVPTANAMLPTPLDYASNSDAASSNGGNSGWRSMDSMASSSHAPSVASSAASIPFASPPASARSPYFLQPHQNNDELLKQEIQAAFQAIQNLHRQGYVLQPLVDKTWIGHVENWRFIRQPAPPATSPLQHVRYYLCLFTQSRYI